MQRFIVEHSIRTSNTQNLSSKITYILFNKPYLVLSQFSKVEGKKTLDEFGFPKGVYPVGRLDEDSEGLLLLTDDGKLKHKLEEPKFQHPRTYLVQVEDIPDENTLQKLRDGIEIKNRNTKSNFKTLPALVELLQEDPNIFPRSVPIRFRKNIPTSWLRIILHEGKNRQVRRMTAAVGFPTLRLVRIAIGFLSIDGLEIGKWRELNNDEIKLLKGVLK